MTWPGLVEGPFGTLGGNERNNDLVAESALPLRREAGEYPWMRIVESVGTLQATAT